MDVGTMTTNRRRATVRPSSVPPVSPLLFRLFSGYVRHYLQRSFHAVRLLSTGAPPQATDLPLVIYCNHPSWWDPLVCIFLARHFFPARTHYGPIDAQALARYGCFARLGFFGVTPGTRQGATTFLRIGRAILQQPKTVLWMTPEGQFSDPRQRPVRFQPGLGHLARHIDRGIFVPLALEYPFWLAAYYPRLRAVRRFGYPWREALLSPLASCCYSSFSGTRVGAPYVDAQRPGKAEPTPLLKPVSMYTTPVAVTHNTATRHCPGAGYSALSAEAL